MGWILFFTINLDAFKDNSGRLKRVKQAGVGRHQTLLKRQAKASKQGGWSRGALTGFCEKILVY